MRKGSLLGLPFAFKRMEKIWIFHVTFPAEKYRIMINSVEDKG